MMRIFPNIIPAAISTLATVGLLRFDIVQDDLRHVNALDEDLAWTAIVSPNDRDLLLLHEVPVRFARISSLVGRDEDCSLENRPSLCRHLNLPLLVGLRD